jgi:hypothetical protein
MVSIRFFNAHTGIPFTREQYYDLKTAHTRARKIFFKEGAESMSIADFLQGLKKGSRKYRKILGYETKDYDITKLTQVNTMARITNTNVPNIERVKGMYSMWGKSYLNNDLRVFLLKYYNNILGLGNRIAHFVQNAESRCTFCLLSNRLDPVAESFEHIFYSCPSTQIILKKFFKKFLTPILSAENYFTGSGTVGNEKENVPFSLTLDILRYFIWQCKLNKRLPIYSCIIDDVSYTINVIRKTNMEISDLFEHCTLFIRRNEPVGDRERDAADRHGRG